MNTICLIVGPYSNLTTLTASIFSLHPRIRVLNHYNSFNECTDTNFLITHSHKKWDDFIIVVLALLEKNISIPGVGGTITKSHAFKRNPQLLKLYNSVKKCNIRSIVWKESHKNTNLLNESVMDFYPKLRLLLPIRNPLDCAVSMAKCNYGRYYPNKPTSKEAILTENIKLFKKLFDLGEKYPNQFFSFFQKDILEDKLFELEQFLETGHDNDWKKNVLSVWSVENKYNHDDKFVKLYHKLLNKYFSENTGLLIKFKDVIK